MTDDYEKFCKGTDVSNQSIQFYLDGMNEENGEISGIFKRIRRGDYGEDAKHISETASLAWIIDHIKGVKTDLLKEIGDRHWYTTRLLQEIDSDWKEVEQINIDKLKKRVEDKTILGHGDER